MLYPNLLGQKAARKLTNEQMAEILGVSRQTFEAKLKSGRFTPEECKRFTHYFKKPFEYLFATDEEIDKTA